MASLVRTRMGDGDRPCPEHADRPTGPTESTEVGGHGIDGGDCRHAELGRDLGESFGRILGKRSDTGRADADAAHLGEALRPDIGGRSQEVPDDMQNGAAARPDLDARSGDLVDDAWDEARAVSDARSAGGIATMVSSIADVTECGAAAGAADIDAEDQAHAPTVPGPGLS